MNGRAFLSNEHKRENSVLNSSTASRLLSSHCSPITILNSDKLLEILHANLPVNSLDHCGSHTEIFQPLQIYIQSLDSNLCFVCVLPNLPINRSSSPQLIKSQYRSSIEKSSLTLSALLMADSFPATNLT